MHRARFLALFVACLCRTLAAQTSPAGPITPVPLEPTPPPLSGRSLADIYFDSTDPELTPQERAALAIAQRWRDSSTVTRPPVVGPDGSLRYLYGAQQITIVCAVLQICDIALQPGERVNDVRIGDRGGWDVAPAVSGSGAQQVVHLVLKPHDVGLETSMMVTTNRRTYHFRLRSHRRDFMARVSFEYPEDASALWDALRLRLDELPKQRVLPTSSDAGPIGLIDALDFRYDIRGQAPWRPVRVYNDGTRTVIQMPAAMRHTEAPVLLVVRPQGQSADDSDLSLVNYRLQADRFIVDTVFDEAVLLAGVGERQSRIVISRSK